LVKRAFEQTPFLLNGSTHVVFLSVLVEYVCDVLSVLPDGHKALFHVEGAAGGHDQVETGVWTSGNDGGGGDL
jgi:hypothetical protein